MNPIATFYRKLKQHNVVVINGVTERFKVKLDKDQVNQITCHKEAGARGALETTSCSFTAGTLLSGLRQLDDGLFLLGSGFESVKIYFDSTLEQQHME